MSVATHVFVLCTACIAGPLLALANAEPAPGNVTLVIAAPWMESETLVATSNGRLIGPSTGYLGALALSEDPDFAANLKKNGAWFVVDGTIIAELCGV